MSMSDAVCERCEAPAKFVGQVSPLGATAGKRFYSCASCNHMTAIEWRYVSQIVRSDQPAQQQQQQIHPKDDKKRDT